MVLVPEANGFIIVSREDPSVPGGGMPRVVWMSSSAGHPGLVDMIADETVATSVEELLPFLEEKGHPALVMDPLF